MNKIKLINLVFITLLFGLFSTKIAFAANFIINSLHYNGGTSYTISTPCCIHFPEYNSGVYKASDDSLFSSFSSYSGIGDTWTINNLPKIPEGIYYFIIKGDRSQDLTIDSNGNAIIVPTPTPTPAPPVINSFPGASIYLGDIYTATGSFSDPDSTSWTATVDYGDGSGEQPLSLSATNFTLNHSYSTAGSFQVTVVITDNQSLVSAPAVANVTVNNLPATSILSGIVINQENQPLSGVTVSKTPVDNTPDVSSSTVTNANGEYSFTLYVGTYNVRAVPSAESGLRAQSTLYKVVNNTDTVQNFLLFPIGPTLNFSGHLLDQTGHSVPNQLVALLKTDGNGNGDSMFTDASGKFSLNITPSFGDFPPRYQIYLQGFNNPPSLQVPQNYNAHTETKSYIDDIVTDIKLYIFSITAHVVDLDGLSVPNVTIGTASEGACSTNPHTGFLGSVNHVQAESSSSGITDASGNSTIWVWATGCNRHLGASTTEGINANIELGPIESNINPTIVLPFHYHHNVAPQINSLPETTLNEGDTYSAGGSFTDPDSSSWTAAVDYGDGSGVQSLILSGTNFSLSHLYKDNGTYTVAVSITDNQVATGTGAATITVNNVIPTVGDITVSTNPVQINAAVITSANFTDPGTLDTHTAVWHWGDGTTSNGTVTESNGSGAISDNHTYTAAGVYTIILIITDKDGGIGTAVFQYVVVYDPSAGFVTGGGTITSPTGAYTKGPTFSGKAIFGFVSKYQKGASVPTGNTEFQFKVANFNFHSTSYDWLVVGGARAQYKGSGTINGNGDYGFILSSIDGQRLGGGRADKFRIKIIDKTTGDIIYDNQIGASDTTDPSTAIDSGSITIHN